jgi:hypothetical protein
MVVGSGVVMGLVIGILLLGGLGGCTAPADSGSGDTGRADTGAPDTDSGGLPDPDTSDSDSADTDSGDTADTDTGDTDPGDPCADPPDPERPMGFGDVMGRLETQGCLADEDIDAAVTAVDGFFATETVWCDAVYRLSSPDGLSFAGEPELVREHASVPDVVITDDGTHVLVFNDLTPGLFEDTLRSDPARFRRQGLVGLGGLGMLVDAGSGFTEADPDLHLASLQVVVDPDLAQRPDGDYRFVYFGVPATTFDGSSWDPYESPAPHGYDRTTGADYTDLPTPEEVVASAYGARGGADPTVLDQDGDELLLLGDFGEPMPGWTAPAGVYPALGTEPDVSTGLPASAPDVALDPDGPARLYYVEPGTGAVRLATSGDGRTWTPMAGAVLGVPFGHGVSVARDPGGTWWMYFNVRDGGCGG